MPKRYLAPALALGALMITLTACDTPTATPEAEAPTTEAPAETAETIDRTDFEPLPVPADAVGAEPTEVALATFGSTEPGEGNFEETTELLEDSSDGALVVLTQTGLADDSVNGMRYWLEFVPEGDQWRLDWAGRQVRCQTGRGSEDWGTALCN